MNKIVLIDGHSILNRAFYGVPPLTNSEGLHTNAVYGFVNIMLKILDSEKPQGLAVAFDLSAPTFRHREYADYKGTRKPMPEELREQVPVIKELLAAMEIPIITMEGYEADDIIGTVAKRYQQDGYEVSIVSGDRDLLQLADAHIKILLPKTSKGETTVYTYYPDDVMAQYGVTPAGIIEMKALMGDTSDNIPGLDGVGEKTATAIIAQYGTIENAHEHAAEVKPPRASRQLLENYDRAQLSKWLATIKTDVPIEVKPEDIAVGRLFTPQAYTLARRLNFKSLMKRFDLSEQERGQEEGTAYLETDDAIYVADLKMLLRHPDRCPDGILKSWLSGRDVIPGFWETQETGRKIYDIGIARYLLNPLNRPEGVTFTAQSAADTLTAVKEAGMWQLYEQIEMPLVYSLARMEQAGIKVDGDRLTAYGEELKREIDVLEQEIYELAGERFNINSPKQLGVVLFEKLSLKGGKKTKTGYSTSADVLEKLADESPVVKKILSYRQLMKLYSTYAVGLVGFIGGDGRIHGTFNQTITATGRISSTEPNLQNIPVRTELGSRIRDVFISKEGYSFVDADYSQIELRVLASISGDEKLIEAYEHAVDVHAVTASHVFHVPLNEVTPQMRRNAKAVNFGVVYGISAFGLSSGLSITKKEAQDYINNYFKTYPQVKAYLDEQIRQAKEHGYVTTIYGRRRPIPELSAGNFMTRQFGERVAMNSPIQGTAADIMKIAMNEVDRRLAQGGYDARIVLQVHDELLVEVADAQAEAVRELVAETMKHAATLKVALETDAHIGKSWLEAK